jgi:hypothetical protein
VKEVEKNGDRVALLDDASIEAIARRVAELLTKTGGERLVSASELAKRLGVERSWVYSNARKLGAVRLSNGPRAQLRFDVDRALMALREVPSGEPKRRRVPGRKRRQATVPAAVELLQGRRNRTL